MPHPESKNTVVFPLESQADYLNSQEREKNHLFSTSNRKHSLFENVNPSNIFKNFNQQLRNSPITL